MEKKGDKLSMHYVQGGWRQIWLVREFGASLGVVWVAQGIFFRWFTDSQSLYPPKILFCRPEMLKVGWLTYLVLLLLLLLLWSQLLELVEPTELFGTLMYAYPLSLRTCLHIGAYRVTGSPMYGKVKCVSCQESIPQQLRREEYKFIDKYRTASLCLNRYES